jgi:hypothetical protein
MLLIFIKIHSNFKKLDLHKNHSDTYFRTKEVRILEHHNSTIHKLIVHSLFQNKYTSRNLRSQTNVKFNYVDLYKIILTFVPLNRIGIQIYDMTNLM